MIAERKGYTEIIALLNLRLGHPAMAFSNIERESNHRNWSMVVVVGEGGVGKSALCNNLIMSMRSLEPESMVEMTVLTPIARGVADVVDRALTELTKSERVYEGGVVQPIERMVNKEGLSAGFSHNLIPGQKHRDQLSDNLETNLAVAALNSAGDLHGNIVNSISLTSSGVKHIATAAPNNLFSMSGTTGGEADIEVRKSYLTLSFIDSRGQYVFNIINHLFLTSYGVYLVVFNMIHVLDESKREQSLSQMSYWINLIVMHTRDSKTGNASPVFLVGTHSDMVSDISDYHRISEVIREKFRYNAGWPSILENKNLSFFPANNLLRHRDESIAHLLSNIENVVKYAVYTIGQKPLTWSRALNELIATKKTFLTFHQASSIATAHGVKEVDVPLFLSFLSKVGVVLWLDEEALRDVVILDVMSFFVEPATIICQYKAKLPVKMQELRVEIAGKEWNETTHRGLVSRKLMEFLLTQKVEASNITIVIKMMLKYGLIVELEETLDRTTLEYQAHVQNAENYLVPSLLQATVGDPTNFQDYIWGNIDHFHSCYFIFTLDTSLLTTKWYNVTTLQSHGFLPRGLMEKLTCEAVKWSQKTTITDLHDIISRLFCNYTALAYGHQQFRLVCIPEINCIRLDIEGDYVLSLYNRIYEQVDYCLKESMGSLQAIPALPLGTFSESNDEFTLLNLEAVRNFHIFDEFSATKSYLPVTRRYVINNYSAWFIKEDILPSFDVFISHRWNKEDDVAIDQLVDAFLGCTVGPEKRAVLLFWDKDRLKEYKHDQKVFGKALINSTIFAPVISTSILQTLETHNPTYEDNVLIEWILALECMENPIHSKMRGIYPLIFGERKSVGALFTEEVIDRLPEIIPIASTEAVKILLEENGIIHSSSLTKRTVRDVVRELRKYAELMYRDSDHRRDTQYASRKIVMRIEEYCDAGDVHATRISEKADSMKGSIAEIFQVSCEFPYVYTYIYMIYYNSLH